MNQSDFKMVCYVRLFCISRELFCVQPRLGMARRSCLEGMPCNFGSVRILEHRGGHWSSSMKSFSAKSSRTLNPLSRDRGRHVGCV